MTLPIEGYASRFYEADLSGDIITKGAFRETLLRTEPAQIKMLFQHLTDTPVGVWDEVYEDHQGLFVRGRIMDLSPTGRLAQSLVKNGVLDGLSIGFRTQKARNPQGGRGRILTQIELWEVSLVTFPMLQSARLKVLSPQALAT